MRYITFDSTGKIVGAGNCQSHLLAAQAKELDQFVVENVWGKVRDILCKVVFDGFDIKTKLPVNPRIENKTPEELEADKIPDAPVEKRQVGITHEQLQAITDRLAALENKLSLY